MSIIRIPCINPSGCGVKFHFRGTKAACMLPKRDNPTSVALRYATNTLPNPIAMKYDTMEPEEYKETIAAIASEIIDDPSVNVYLKTDAPAHRVTQWSRDPVANARIIANDSARLKANYERYMAKMGVPTDTRFSNPIEDIKVEAQRQYAERDLQKKEVADAKLKALGFDKSAPEEFTPEEVQRLYAGNSKIAKLRAEYATYSGTPTERSQEIIHEVKDELLKIGLQKTKIPYEYPRKSEAIDDLAGMLTPEKVYPPELYSD